MTTQDTTTVDPYPEKEELKLKPGTLKRIDAVLKSGESRADFVREATRHEIRRRQDAQWPRS